MSHIKRSQGAFIDEAEAVNAFARALMHEDMGGVIFFCSSNYDLQRLGAEIDKAFSCPVIGCTTAGEIGDSYQEKGLVGVSFSSDVFSLKPYLISQISQFCHQQVENMADTISSATSADSLRNRVGFLLIDGLSLMEERVVAALSGVLANIPIIGGSAGDELKFDKTYIYYDGRFHQDAAVLTLIETSLDIEICKLQHIVPTDSEVVVTAADPKSRTVYELDGEPALSVYARKLNIQPEPISPDVFSRYPVMLQVCGEWYVRSIRNANADGSLTLFCAIENGLPLTISRGGDIVKNLSDKVDELSSRFSNIDLTLGCDCILRRLEIINTDKIDDMSPLLKKLNFLGFSTYGEQYKSLHVNQTLTCVVFGTKK